MVPDPKTWGYGVKTKYAYDDRMTGDPGDPTVIYLYDPPQRRICPKCGGRGRLLTTEQVPDRLGRPIPTTSSRACPDCGGSGSSLTLR